MPLRTSRRHAAALILAGLALVLQGCALDRENIARFEPPPSRDIPVNTPQTGAGEIWQVVEGAPVSGERELFTGVQNVRFMQPIAVAARGQQVYVIDAGSRQLFRYDIALDRLTLVKDMRGLLSGNTAYLHVSRDLSFYIADADGARVLQFDPDGRLLREIKDRINIGRPISVLVNEYSGYLFIADGANDDVMVFNPEGLLTGAIGVRGLGAGRFLNITALAQGPLGFYVGTRIGASRVQIMGDDGRYSDSLQQNTVIFPTAIAVDSEGRAYVSDYLTDDIKVYDGTKLIGVIGGHGSAPGRFRRITALWLDEGFLYVADSLNRRIQILTLASWQPAPPAAVGEPASQ
ncbi:MAG: hypothetical protein LBV36_04320 [Chromatiales bacterium]|jgi:DNA-binding beta-propeller fold protein YncE|nr:hypothetical protein [Chromatiales bacterium]